MSKIDNYEFRRVPQEVVDFKDQVTELLNFGKYQPQVLNINSSAFPAAPGYPGRQGELVWVIDNDTSGALYVNSVDSTATWSLVIAFVL